MIQAAVTFGSVILAASIAYLAALAAWRRQQRREVYGAYVAAVDYVLDSLDLLLAEGGDTQLRQVDGWEQFRRARIKFDAAWGQARLVAPTRIAEHAARTGYALLNFERCAKDLTVDEAREERKDRPFLGWAKAKEFVVAARDDLGVDQGFWQDGEDGEQTRARAPMPNMGTVGRKHSGSQQGLGRR